MLQEPRLREAVMQLHLFSLRAVVAAMSALAFVLIVVLSASVDAGDKKKNKRAVAAAATSKVRTALHRW